MPTPDPNFNSTIPAPPVSVPFVKPRKVGNETSLVIEDVWYRFLLTLWLRSGGTHPIPIPVIEGNAELALATEDDPQPYQGLTFLGLVVPTSQEPTPSATEQLALALTTDQEPAPTNLAPILAVTTEQEPTPISFPIALATTTEQEPALDPILAALAVSTDQEPPAVYTASWTPTDASGATLTFTSVSANYTKMGNMVFAYATLTYPVTADASTAIIGGLPLPVPNQSYARSPFAVRSNGAFGVYGQTLINTTTFQIYNNATNTALINSDVSGTLLRFIIIYPVA